MKKSVGANLRTFLLVGAASVACMPSLAIAQDAEEEAAPEEKLIVVTGTLIRSKAPVGSNTIALGQNQLEETAAISANALLASVPQVTNYFNRVPASDLSIAVNQIQVSRPNLRNISGNNAASSATLILVDGHRVASAGVNQASIDPDLIVPAGAIERIEVMTEGGSATYGADAVAGVINYITKKRFNGVAVGGSYGFAKNYYQYDAKATVGKEWDNGSVYVSYNYAKSDSLYGRDRDFIRNVDYSTATYVGRDIQCVNPNLAVNTVLTNFGFTLSSVNYAAPGFLANTSNRCDNSQNSTIVPKVERHNVMGGLTWDFGESTSVDARVYWSQRKSESRSVLTGSVNVNANNAYASSLPAGLTLGLQPFTIFGSPVVNQAAVNFSLEPLLGLDSQRSDVKLREWGANIELSHDLSDEWQVRALANWSQSDSGYQLTGINSARLNAAGSPTTLGTTANSFNPFNVVNNNAALIADLIDNEIAGQTKDNLLQLRLLTEGKLFDLPGGDARIAFGYEFMNDKLKRRFQSAIRIGTLDSFPFTSYSRNVHSFFGEVNLPVLGDGDGGSMLTLSGAGRYDKYSDFGNTFNPKVGVVFEPVKGFKLRGNWGTSFTAPTPLDQLGSLGSTISGFGFVPFVQPGSTLLPGANNTIAFQGSIPGLQPQEADTWSVGFEVEPTKGFRAKASYYSVDFTNILGTPTANAGIFTDFPNNILYNVNGSTAAQVTSFLTQSAPLSASLQTQLTNTLNSFGGGRVVEVVDFRVGNFGIVKVKGVDAELSLDHDTGFGGIDFLLNVNVPLERKRQASPTSAISDEQRIDNPELFLKAEFGVDVGNFRAQTTWNHTSGYNIIPTASVPVQSRVGNFDTMDLFFKYAFAGEGMIMKDLSLTLNISNVTDAEPPILRRNNPNEFGFANGFTLGRMFILGLSKKF